MKPLLLLLMMIVCLEQVTYGRVSEGDGIYFSRKIKMLAEALPLDIPKKDTMLVIPSLVSNKDFVFRYNERNELVHIGISLFSSETKNMLDSKICNFLERFLLELLLVDKDEARFKLNEYRIQLWMDGQDYTEQNLWHLSDFLQIMEMPVCFSMTFRTGHGTAIWSFGIHTLHVDFPLYRELIEGTDKKESDADLYNRIQGAAFSCVEREDDEISRELLVKKTNDIYVLPGEKFQIRELSSDRYFIKEHDDFKLVFHENFPEFSLNNLFLTYANGKNVTLQLLHRQYGHFTPEISVPLLSFLEYFRQEFLFTCHTSYNRQGKLETIVVIQHKTLNYIHLLRVYVDRQDLFKPNLFLKGDFYSNIPQHYIKTLLR